MHMQRRMLFLSAAAILTAFSPLPAQRIKLPVGLDKLEDAVRADSNDALAHYNVALGYWSKGRYDKSEGELKESVQLDPRYAPAYLALAYLPFARTPKLWESVGESDVTEEVEKTLEGSDRMYKRAFLIDPLVELRIVGAVVPPKSVMWSVSDDLAAIYRDWVQGFDDFRDGHYKDAFFRFERMVRAYGGRKRLSRVPESIVWLQGLSAAHIDKYDDALRNIQVLYNHSLALEEGDDLIYLPLRTNDYRYLLAFLDQRAGRTDRAVKLYREVLEHDLGLYMAHVRLAEIHEARKQWNAALLERRRAVESNPDDASLILDLGLVQARMGRFSDALKTMKDVIAANPRDARPYYFVGLLSQRNGHRKEAREAWERFLELAPSRYAKRISQVQARLRTLR